MQILTLSLSTELKIAELKEKENEYSSFFSPCPMPDILISPLYEDGRLAYYDNAIYAIVFNESFIMNATEIDRDGVLVHELAHALQYKKEGYSDHKEGFRSYVSLLGGDPEYSHAKVRIEHEKKESISRKIEKLMALSSSPYEEESRSAFQMAQKLISKHGITRTDKSEKKLYYIGLRDKKRYMTSEKEMLALVSLLTGTYLIYEMGAIGKRATVYGTVDQIESAIYLYDYLERELEESLKIAKKEKKNLNNESYRIGMVLGLYDRCLKDSSETEEGKALIVTQNEIKNDYLILRKCKIRHARGLLYVNSPSDYQHGREMSKNMKIPQNRQKHVYNRQIEYKKPF